MDRVDAMDARYARREFLARDGPARHGARLNVQQLGGFFETQTSGVAGGCLAIPPGAADNLDIVRTWRPPTSPSAGCGIVAPSP